MWINFRIECNSSVQHRLHRAIKSSVRSWQKTGIIQGAILTYHYTSPPRPNDSLYICLDIPTVTVPSTRTEILPNETARSIPTIVTNTIQRICTEEKLSVTRSIQIQDYEFVAQQAKRRTESQGKSYYGGAPVEEIIRLATVGTEIALVILDERGDQDRPIPYEPSLHQRLERMIAKRLGKNYPLIKLARHFIRNPLPLEQPSWAFHGYL